MDARQPSHLKFGKQEARTNRTQNNGHSSHFQTVWTTVLLENDNTPFFSLQTYFGYSPIIFITLQFIMNRITKAFLSLFFVVSFFASIAQAKPPVRGDWVNADRTDPHDVSAPPLIYHYNAKTNRTKVTARKTHQTYNHQAHMRKTYIKHAYKERIAHKKVLAYKKHGTFDTSPTDPQQRMLPENVSPAAKEPTRGPTNNPTAYDAPANANDDSSLFQAEAEVDEEALAPPAATTIFRRMDCIFFGGSSLLVEDEKGREESGHQFASN